MHTPLEHTSLEHTPLEQYLQAVQMRLHELPQEQRQSEVEEIRQHIETMVQAHQELGASEEEAVAQALAQFGKAQAVSTQLARAYKRRRPSARRSLSQAFGCALISFFGLNLLTCYLCNMFGPEWGSPMYADCLLAHPIVWLLSALIYNFSWGYLTGVIVPRRAVAGTLLVYIPVHLVNLLSIVHNWYNTPLHCAGVVAFAVSALSFDTGLAMWGSHSGAKQRQLIMRRRRAAQ